MSETIRATLPPIPARLGKRPTFHGMPVPFTVLILDGKPDFRATDIVKWHLAVDCRLCAVCGDPLDSIMYFIGGESCVRNRLFFDSAMHKECAEYSFAVCPFLAFNKGYNTAPLKQVPGYKLNIDANMGTALPKRLAMVSTTGYKKVLGPGGRLYLKIYSPVEVVWKENPNYGRNKPGTAGCPYHSKP